MPPPRGIRDIDPLIYNFQVVQGLHRSEIAMQTLQRVASVVKPIMRAHNFKIGTLAEFYPKEKGLLGLNTNSGQQICLRLRYPADSSQFQTFEMVVDTMLHELSHNKFGPHDASFHALWDQLRDEYAALTARGFTGAAFLSHGQRVGGQRIPRDEARRIARNAAEGRRRKLAAVHQRLGGGGPRPGADMRSTIAGAALGRLQVESGCASQRPEEEQRVLVEQANFNGFKTKAEEDDANEVAIQQALWELAQEDRGGSEYPPSGASNPTPTIVGTSASSPFPSASRPPPKPARGHSTKPDPLFSSTRTHPSSSTPSSASAPISLLDSDSDSDGGPPPAKPPPQYIQLVDDDAWWACQLCTLVNEDGHLCCAACGAEQPGAPPPKATAQRAPPTTNRTAPSRKPAAVKPVARAQPETWTCTRCTNVMGAEWWTCAVCGTLKARS